MIPRRAMTLIEVVAAVALLAMVMAASLRVSSNLLRSQAAIEPIQHELGDLQDMVNLLREDLLHVDAYKVDGTDLLLRSRAWLEPGSMNRVHCGSIVRYRPTQVGSRVWMVRTQQRDGTLDAQMVGAGIDAIRIESDTAGGHRQEWRPLDDAIVATIKLGQQERRLYIRRR